MERKKTVVAAMSGGVDSAVAAALLKRQGYDVIGITLQIWQEHAEQGKHGGCCSLGAVEDARRAANRIGIPHYVLNFRDYFARKVIDCFVNEYARGRTPNPCVECNRSVKFDELLRQAENLGADYLATGHYARIDYNETTGRYELRRARDRVKDQSYVLFPLKQTQLARTLMPLGEVESKAETRRIARELGLPLADKPDSQEICFVPKEGYTKFLAERAPSALHPGRIVDTGGRLRGTHEGIANYTIGQRKRLPASGDGPLYVIALEPATNTVIVGSDEELLEDTFTVRGLNWIAVEKLDTPLAVSARIRYNASAVPARIFAGPEPDTVVCRVEMSQRAITPGQAAVFYDGERVIGGGTIEEVGAKVGRCAFEHTRLD
jgi:tRNA-specific 2-thiouridylase